MEWHIYPHEDKPGNWVVQAINLPGEGEIYTTIFSDSDAEQRAREYYELRAGQQAIALEHAINDMKEPIEKCELRAELRGLVAGLTEAMAIATWEARGWIITVPRLNEAIRARIGELKL